MKKTNGMINSEASRSSLPSTAFLVPAPAHHFFVDAIPFFEPLGVVGRQGAFLRQPDAAIQRNPVHDLGVGEMLFPIAHLPNACVGTLPILADPFQALADL